MSEAQAKVRRLVSTEADDPSFDRISALAARALKAPLALVSLVEKDQQLFKGMSGTLPEPWHSQRSTPLSHSFCQHVQATGEPLVVPNAREHPLVRDNLAITDLNIIAYLGVPLTTASGHTLGSFCVIDHQPRQWTAEEAEILRGLGSLAMIEIEARLGRGLLQANIASLKAGVERRAERTRLLVHDLRTPLNSLMLGLKTLPILGDMNPDQLEALEIALRGGESVVKLVDDMLDTDAAEQTGAASLRITPGLDAAVLMAQAIAQVAAMAAHGGLTLSIETGVTSDGGAVEPGPVAVDADADKFIRALVNLISNAVKFTPLGGQIGVSARRESGPDGGCVVFDVRDTGRGIPALDLERIFERFVHLEPRGKQSQRSSGLGLSFVKAVAEAHDGRVAVRSTLGSGSVFSLIVPEKQKTRPPE